VTILGEIYFAVYASHRRDKNYQALQDYLSSMIIWPFEEAAAEEFGLILAEQKSKGRTIPPMDAQIAAIARLHDLTLLTADHHFQFVERLKIENWLV